LRERKYLITSFCKSKATRVQAHVRNVEQHTVMNSIFTIGHSFIFNVQAWTSPEGSSRIRLLGFMTIGT
jgi:hypothetical protein